ncbi:MAG: hypothetical protein IJZ82_00070 [Lachnospiraceae bacterium]|nr:hypothetical protein [Lachnospiraceae bacterium]
MYNYISINTNSLYELISNIGVSSIVILLCYFGAILIQKSYKKNKWNIILWVLTIFVTTTTLFVVMRMFSGETLVFILKYILQNKKQVFGMIFALSVIIGLMLFISAVAVQEIKYIVSWIKGMSINAKNCLIITGAGVVALILCCVIMYYTCQSSYKSDLEMSIVMIDEEQYVVIDQYAEQWIIKPCKIVEGTVYVNEDIYVFKNIESYPIRNYHNEINVGESLLTNEQFISVQN